MRYLLQVFVMLSDIIIFAVMGMVLYIDWRNPITWIVILFAFSVWKKTGAFEAWNPKTIRQFLRNAKEIGL